MLTILSPAKSLDFESPSPTATHTQPSFVSSSEKLIKKLQKLSVKKLGELMSISEALAELNHERNAQWRPEFSPEEAKQAVLAFTGDVYQGLEANTFSEEDFAYAQNHLRILSGLYGLLRPLDLIHPYRLEMGTKLAVGRSKNLYDFWGMTLTDAVNAQLKEIAEPVLVNLASNEYFKAIKPKKVEGRIITPVFKDEKNGQFKVISFFAKKARGMMAKYIIQNRIESPEGMKGFDGEGYIFNEAMSKENEWVFVR